MQICVGAAAHQMGRTPCLPQKIAVTRPLSQLSSAISCISEVFLILQETLLTNLAKSEICKKISRGRLRFFLQIFYINGFARSISCKALRGGSRSRQNDLRDGTHHISMQYRCDLLACINFLRHFNSAGPYCIDFPLFHAIRPAPLNSS